MDGVELLLTVLGLVVLAGLCAVAVLSPAYDDTLMQRVALGTVCIGALGVAWWCWRRGEAPGPVVVLAVGAGLFALETARKLLRRMRRGCWQEAPRP